MPQEPTIALKEFTTRRNKLMKKLNGAVGLVFAGDVSSPLHEDFHVHPHFLYLTGITDERGAILMLDPSSPFEERQVVLFLRPLNPEVDRWDGYRSEINTALKEATGIKTIFRTSALSRFLRDAAIRSKKLACLHPLATHTQTVSPDLDIFQKVASRVPGVSIEDHTEQLAIMRSSKSSAEVKMLQQAIDISAIGYDAVLKKLQPGMNEFDVQQLLEGTYKSNGARGTMYGSIVGGGLNATVLHYRANDQKLEDGDLVCIDSGAGYRGYSADITRTFPVNGKFSKRQKEIYNIVLKAELAAIKAVKPGVSLVEIDKTARDVVQDAGFGDFFPHGTGHHLGLEVHDITPLTTELKLEPGAVITIEPGIYLPDEKMGIRIEDDILVTKTGSKNLSKSIPKTIDEIEAAMAG